MVVLLSLSSAAAASPKPKMSDIDANALVGAILAVHLADTIILTLNKNDVKTDRIALAKELAPIVKGVLYV